ncbi:MAG: 2-iminoacetate synthase ThiH, partial [Sedimenticola sp.]|nr:2-iminoacetate synthase ThiH [Sedimenticola sp.]
QADYERLIKQGLNSVLLYQETYHRDNYPQYHPKGKKRNFEYRLETPDRLGRAGIHRIGLGTLLGLEEWRTDAAFVALHLGYLERQYWQTKYSISLPRLRPAEGVQSPNVEVTDRDFVQLICAYRIYSENVEISLSTRERPEFRDHLLKLGITSMSAGSKTEPGGYAIEEEALEQFEISDERTPEEVAAMIRRQGFEPVWKDWDSVLG